VLIHAGGIAAYNGYLYVADTYNGLRCREPKLVRRPLSPGWTDVTGTLVANDLHEIGRRQMQGAVGVSGTYCLSVSAGETRRGQLMSWKPGGGPPVRQSRLPTGPEDLSCHGGEKVMWTVGEYDDFRYAYAVDPTA
jgi:hypothetical protein